MGFKLFVVTMSRYLISSVNVHSGFDEHRRAHFELIKDPGVGPGSSSNLAFAVTERLGHARLTLAPVLGRRKQKVHPSFHNPNRAVWQALPVTDQSNSRCWRQAPLPTPILNPR